MNKDIASNLSGIEEYKVKLAAYETKLKSNVELYNAKLGNFREQANMFSVEVGNARLGNEATIQKASLVLNSQLKAADIALEEAKTELATKFKAGDIELEAAKIVATTAAQRMASALNSINATASLGFQESKNGSISCAEQHNYDERCCTVQATTEEETEEEE